MGPCGSGRTLLFQPKWMKGAEQMDIESHGATGLSHVRLEVWPLNLCVVTEAHVCEQLVRSCYEPCL